MTGHLTSFVRALREAGLVVSPAEAVDAAAALQVLPAEDRAAVFTGLRACLCKETSDLPVFETLFAAHFTAAWPAGEEARGKRRKPGAAAGRASRRSANQPAPQPPEGRPTASPPRPSQPSPEPAEPRHRATAAAEVEAVRQASDRERHAAAARARSQRERQRRASPAHRLWPRRFDHQELVALDREAERLGRALRAVRGRRYRRSRRGRVDLRATVAAACRTGGVPFRLHRRQSRLLRPRLLVLCDVSGSVRHVARFLLRFVREVAGLFADTHTFVFVDRPVDADGLLRSVDFEASLDDLEQLHGLDLWQRSDFGHTFIQLLDQHHHLLRRRTSVLVLGDARCNQFDPQAWALAELAGRVSQVIWLNPERRERWYTADSRLRDYEQHLDAVLPAGSLAELAAGIDRLLRPSRPEPRR